MYIFKENKITPYDINFNEKYVSNSGSFTLDVINRYNDLVSSRFNKSISHDEFMNDIDNFKLLNDTYGHQAGDRFLIEFADYLKRNFRDSDVIGRIGGDEFFVFTKNIIDDDMIDGKARNILEIIHNVGDKYAGVGIGGSIGISVYPKDGTSLEELYSKADEALYRAKKSGKNRYSRAE